MAQMDYFRRPVLAGRNVKRLAFGTIRGSVRRKDADGTSTVPYFPGVAATQTLIIQTETGTYTATLSSSSMLQVLADTNTALGVHGTAFDADGAIGLRTAVLGGTGFIQVNGGTASAALGFDTTLGRPLRSNGGDIESAPEGRVGNPFGTVFPGAGENITADIFQRSLARIAANLDVVYSDLVRESAVLQKVPTFTLDATAGAYITLPATTRIFNGYVNGASILSRLSTAQDLAPFFAVVDAATKQLLPYKVVAVVNGSPTGAPPFLDAANSADASKNVLGLNLSKFAATAITNIRDGRVLTSTGVGSAAAVGDLAQVASATNTTKWSNNGMKWIVEQVIDANNIVLRPASQAFLTQLGISLTDAQPVLELADDLTSGQSYGTIQIFTGSFSSGVSLVLSPPAPIAGSYELWAAQPLSLRSRQSWHEQQGVKPFTQNLNPFRSGSDAIVPLSARRNSASATADIFQALDEANVVLAKIASSGSISGTSLDRATAGVLNIGATTATGVSLSRAGQVSTVQGGLDVIGGGRYQFTDQVTLTATWIAVIDVINRLYQAIGAEANVSGVVAYWYRGNNNPNTLSGQPNPDQVSIVRTKWDTTNHFARLDLTIHAAALGDNLDGLRYVMIEWFAQTTTFTAPAGTATIATTPFAVTYHTLSDRLYVVPTTVSVTNDTKVTAALFDPALTGTYLACRVSIFGVKGNAAARAFVTQDTGTADGSAMYNMGTDVFPTAALKVSPVSATKRINTSVSFTASGGTAPYTWAIDVAAGGNNSGGSFTSATNLATVTWFTGTTADVVDHIKVTDSTGSPQTVSVPITVTAPPDPPPGGGGGGFVFCPAPEVLITMADGSQKPAGELVVGDSIYTAPEWSNEYGTYTILGAQLAADAKRKRVTFTDGRSMIFTVGHQLKVSSSWLTIPELKPGMIVNGRIPGVIQLIEAAEDGPCVIISTDAKTYENMGVLSHNVCMA